MYQGFSTIRRTVQKNQSHRLSAIKPLLTPLSTYSDSDGSPLLTGISLHNVSEITELLTDFSARVEKVLVIMETFKQLHCLQPRLVGLPRVPGILFGKEKDNIVGSVSDDEGESRKEGVQASTGNLISHSDSEEESLAAVTLSIILHAQKALQMHCPAGSQHVFATHGPDQNLFPKAYEGFCQTMALLEENFCNFLKVWAPWWASTFKPLCMLVYI